MYNSHAAGLSPDDIPKIAAAGSSAISQVAAFLGKNTPAASVDGSVTFAKPPAYGFKIICGYVARNPNFVPNPSAPLSGPAFILVKYFEQKGSGTSTEFHFSAALPPPGQATPADPNFDNWFVCVKIGDALIAPQASLPDLAN
jgi:hypothetical protein